jgi:hypothetical protein
MKGLRLMVFDRTCGALTASWHAGGLLYALLGRLDARKGVRSWPEALAWLGEVRPGEPIAEIQFWGHGNWGCAKVAGEPLDVSALSPTHPWHAALQTIRGRLVGPDALWWFRTCETFGRREGHRFAREWTDFFQCRAAGHTYLIGPWQSGLHALAPGQAPDWSQDEGLPRGESAPRQALWSSPRAPNTITCFHGKVPPRY